MADKTASSKWAWVVPAVKVILLSAAVHQFAILYRYLPWVGSLPEILSALNIEVALVISFGWVLPSLLYLMLSTQAGAPRPYLAESVISEFASLLGIGLFFTFIGAGLGGFMGTFAAILFFGLE